MMNPARLQSGFSYIEMLIASVLIAITLVPAMNALRGAQEHSAATMAELDASDAVSSRLEIVLAEPFSSLNTAALAAGSFATASSYSDAAGTTDRIVVYIGAYDGDNADADNDPFTGTDTGLLIVRVAQEDTGQQVDVLVAE